MAISKSLLDIQKEIIKETLDNRRKSGEIKSDAEYAYEKEDWEKKLSNQKTIGQPVYQVGKTDSSSYNQLLEGVGMDLGAVFDQILSTEEKLTKHGILNKSLVNQLNRKIKQTEEEIKRQERLRKANFSEDIFTESFTSGVEKETDTLFYADKDDVEVSIGNHAEWSTSLNGLRLPVISSENVFIGAGGSRMGSVRIRKQLGIPTSINTNESLHSIFDTNTESFWAEQVYAEAPIEVEMGEDYYNLDHGAVCEIEIAFDYMTSLNEIGLDVIGAYPLNVVGIRYFTTDAEKEEGIELVHPGTELTSMKSRSVTDRTGFSFLEIQVKRIRIVFNQVHSVMKDLHLSSKEERNRILLERGECALPNAEAKDLLLALQEDKKEYVTRYEYEYGLRSLELKRNEYHERGVYVSKPIDTKGTVRIARLESEEVHSEKSRTDIEYAIHDGVVWHPVLPVHASSVKSERLFPKLTDGTYKCELRFKAASRAYQVFRNGLPVVMVVLLEDNKTVLFGEYDPASYYTINYTPVKSAWMINFSELNRDDKGYLKMKRTIEDFNGTGNDGSITLSEYPLADRKRLNEQKEDYDPSYLDNAYLPIRVRIVTKDGYHIEQPTDTNEKNLQIRNATDYFSEEEVSLRPFDDHDVFHEYKIEGNRLLFNAAIPKDSKITIEYDHMVSKLRLKAVLRRNTSTDSGSTPVLTSYSIRTQKIR